MSAALATLDLGDAAILDIRHQLTMVQPHCGHASSGCEHASSGCEDKPREPRRHWRSWNSHCALLTAVLISGCTQVP